MREDRFIRNRIEVEEGDAASIYPAGKSGPLGGRDSGNVFIVGFPGTGRALLARELAERTGRTFADPVAGKLRLDEVCAAGGLAVPIPAGLLRRAEHRRLLKENGKVLYRMAEPAALAAAAAAGDPDPEEARRRFFALYEELHPLCMEVANFLLMPHLGPEQVLESALEKLAL